MGAEKGQFKRAGCKLRTFYRGSDKGQITGVQIK